jgi:hypothetical protein
LIHVFFVAGQVRSSARVCAYVKNTTGHADRKSRPSLAAFFLFVFRVDEELV